MKRLIQLTGMIPLCCVIFAATAYSMFSIVPADSKAIVHANEDSDGAKILDATKVYYGKPQSFKKPSTVRFSTVSPHIPEYKIIKKKGLKPGDAEYQILAQEGSKRFRRLVKAVAAQRGFDLVAEESAIAPPKGVVLPDISQDVIKKLGGS